MTTFKYSTKKLHTFNLIAIITLLMTACAPNNSSRKNSNEPLPGYLSGQDIDNRLVLAAQKPYPERAQIILDYTKEMLETNPENVKPLLDDIPYDDLPQNIQAELAIQQATIASLYKRNWEVFEWLDRESIINHNNQESLAKSHMIKAITYKRFGEYNAALDEWIQADPFITLSEKAKHYDSFWETLLHVQLSRIESSYYEVNSNELRGWLSLAMIYQSEIPLEQQITKAQRWFKQWPDHPAAAYLPKNLEHFNFNTTQNHEIIAVLIPLSGNLSTAGNSVKNGLITAHYEAVAKKNSEHPEIRFYDTYNSDINELAIRAIQEGAQLLIGPLSKTNVDSLRVELFPHIPILTLNYLSEMEEEHNHQTNELAPKIQKGNLFQFSLSAEEEAKMAGRRAIMDGHRRAIVITSGSDWGKKIGRAFTQTLLANEGEVVASVEFSDNTQFSAMVGRLLDINQSQQRARKMNRLLEETLGFQPRRRQDIDMVFIGAAPKEARQIKPALAYQYAGNLPVYATSSAFSGSTNINLDQDMDGVRIPMMPWLHPDQTTDIKRKVMLRWPESRTQYGPLYALGVDAYNIYPRLQQLLKLQNSQYQGLTGSLSISPDGKIHRELTWQLFKNGRLRPLPIPRQIATDISGL